MDYGRPRSRSPRQVDGIIGFELFNNFVVEIDYAASRLRVFDHKNYQHSGKGKINVKQ